MPDGPRPVQIFTVTAIDAEMIARSCEAIQRSCELLRGSQHLASYLAGPRADLLAPMADDADGDELDDRCAPQQTISLLRG